MAKGAIRNQTFESDFATKKHPPHIAAQIALLRAFLFVTGIPFHIFGFALRDAMATTIGFVLYPLVGRSRRIAMKNLDIVYGDEKTLAEKKAIVRGMFRHFARLFIDFFWTEHIYSKEYLKNIPFGGIEIFEEILDKKNGIITFLGHLGNWEVGGAAASVKGMHVSPIFKKFSSPLSDYLLGKKRDLYGLDMLQIPDRPYEIGEDGKKIRLPRPSMMPMIGKAIEDNNAALVFLADQYAGAKANRITFLGQECSTFVGPVEASRRFGTPIVVSVCVYEGRGLRYHTIGPFEVEEKDSEEETYRYNIERLNEALESFIHRWPDQYAWGHRRFDRHHYKDC